MVIYMAKKKLELRREKNIGSLYQNKSGKWIAVADFGRDNEGKRIRKQVYYGNSKEEAESAVQKANKQKLILRQESFTNSFCSLMKHWLLSYKQPTVTSRTFENDMSHYRNHIENELKDLAITEVTVSKLQVVLKKIKGKEPRRKTKYLLNQFYNYAVVERLTEYNPIPAIDISVRKTENVLETEETYKAIKPEYREKFFKALEQHNFLKSLCLVAYFSGMRIGEILGLRWQDVDFDNKILNIEHAITFEVEFDATGKRIDKHTILSNTKTKSSRAKLPMSNALAETLQEWKQHQKEHSIKIGNALTNGKNFVFGNDNGDMRTYYGTRTILNRFLEKNGLADKGIHFHAIRHTFGDVLRSKNWSLYDIQKMLRHSKASTTEIYLSMEHNPALKLKSEIENAFEDDDFVPVKQKKKNKDFEM